MHAYRYAPYALAAAIALAAPAAYANTTYDFFVTAAAPCQYCEGRPVLPVGQVDGSLTLPIDSGSFSFTNYVLPGYDPPPLPGAWPVGLSFNLSNVSTYGFRSPNLAPGGGALFSIDVTENSDGTLAGRIFADGIDDLEEAELGGAGMSWNGRFSPNDANYPVPISGYWTLVGDPSDPVPEPAAAALFAIALAGLATVRWRATYTPRDRGATG
jgi:hypothetical protein